MILFRNNTASFGPLSLDTVGAASASFSGSVDWFKDGELGLAYKRRDASAWTFRRSDSTAVAVSLQKLVPGTNYIACLYVRGIDGALQLGDPVDFTTKASSK